jgi:nitrite reductase/ring-hydroxylating ferredoxin subunit/uncharacterized membrane protein
MASLKDVLEGKPLRSPLHPALVHLPIALFPISVLLDVASWVGGSEGGAGLVRGAFGCIIAGLITGLIAGVVGMVDYTEIRDDHPAKKTATLHLVLNLIALGLFGAGAGLRYGTLGAEKTAALPLVVSLVGLLVLSYSGYLGGHLVYSDGVAVGRHRRRTRLPETTLTVPSRAAVGEMIAVADDAALNERATLRIDVSGVVVAIARVDGALYAFQEFCTHRFGPLSEGELRGCKVVCPWHNSRFDVRTGKVTNGPAKVDLRTFRVESRAGKIWIEVPQPPAAPADETKRTDARPTPER